MKKFTWTVQFTVGEAWIRDGFDLTDEKAREMIINALPFAYADEVTAKVLEAPRPQEIKAAQESED